MKIEQINKQFTHQTVVVSLYSLVGQHFAHFNWIFGGVFAKNARLIRFWTTHLLRCEETKKHPKKKSLFRLQLKSNG